MNGAAMTTLRERIEEILREARIKTQADLNATVDALCALLERKEPSREDLIQLLNIKGPKVSGFTWIPFVDAVMSWATSTEPERVWCKHISFCHGMWCYGEDDDWQDAGDWDICPVKNCHAPRPTCKQEIPDREQS